MCWDVLHSSHQICMENIKLTSVKFKFSKTSQQESNHSAINAISDRLSSPLVQVPLRQVYHICHLVKPLAHPGEYLSPWCPFWFWFFFSAQNPTANSHLFNCLCGTFPQVSNSLATKSFLVSSRNAPPSVGRSVTSDHYDGEITSSVTKIK